MVWAPNPSAESFLTFPFYTQQFGISLHIIIQPKWEILPHPKLLSSLDSVWSFIRLRNLHSSRDTVKQLAEPQTHSHLET